MATFNPLGKFDSRAPISDALISNARAFLKTLPTLEDHQMIDSLYLHWSVEKMCDSDAHYNGSATYDSDARKWYMSPGTSVIGNAEGNVDTEAGHTWHRNSFAYGLALAGMEGATPENFGSETVTLAGLDVMCAMAAAVCIKYDIDATGTVDRYDAYYDPVVEPAIFTHSEAAIVDNYYITQPTSDGDTRWDLAILAPLPPGVSMSLNFPRVVGNALRDRIHAIKQVLEHTK